MWTDKTSFGTSKCDDTRENVKDKDKNKNNEGDEKIACTAIK